MWLNLENCLPLRQFIIHEAELVEINIIGENVFIDAVVNTAIAIVTKNKGTTDFRIKNNKEEWNYNYKEWNEMPQKAIEYRVNRTFQSIIKKIEDISIPLENFGELIQGLTPYDKYRGQTSELIKSRGFHFNYKKDNTCGKWLNGENVNRFKLSYSNEWLSYGSWLAAPREPKFFEGRRILFREIPGKDRRIQAVICNEIAYYGHSITPFILHNKEEDSLLNKLLCIVNSKLVSWYGALKLSNFGKEVFPKLNPQDIKQLPIYKNIRNEGSPLVQLAETMLEQFILLENTVQNLLLLLKSNFPSLLISKKLEDWYIIEFSEFLKELGKQKVRLSLEKQTEWLKYVGIEKEKVLAIKQTIKEADNNQIDDIVFDLYGLTELEKTLVSR